MEGDSVCVPCRQLDEAAAVPCENPACLIVPADSAGVHGLEEAGEAGAGKEAADGLQVVAAGGVAAAAALVPLLQAGDVAVVQVQCLG